MRLEQRGAVAFTLVSVAIVVILLITCGHICSKGKDRFEAHRLAYRSGTGGGKGLGPMTKKPVKRYTVDGSLKMNS
jgi:hypothetical protein